jgi:DNA methyltransferase 1-associated protein 1
MPVTKGPHPAAHLRSFKLPVPKASVAPKVAQVLAEIGVQHTRLVIPTRDNLLQLESLLEATYQLLDIKKLVDRTNQEIRVVKSRLQLRASEAPEAKNGDDADMDADAEVGSPMDLDAEGSADRDAEGEVDEERAPSVVSTRSRKNVCYSSTILFQLQSLMVLPDAKIYVHFICRYFCDCIHASNKKTEASMNLVIMYPTMAM